MNGLFATGFRPLQTRPLLAQANVAVTPATTPPAATPPASNVVLEPAGPPVVVNPVLPTANAPTSGVPPIIWVAGAVLLVGAGVYFMSQAGSPRRRR